VSHIQDIGDARDATGDAISRQEMHHLVDNKANKRKKFDQEMRIREMLYLLGRSAGRYGISLGRRGI